MALGSAFSRGRGTRYGTQGNARSAAGGTAYSGFGKGTATTTGGTRFGEAGTVAARNRLSSVLNRAAGIRAAKGRKMVSRTFGGAGRSSSRSTGSVLRPAWFQNRPDWFQNKPAGFNSTASRIQSNRFA